MILFHLKICDNNFYQRWLIRPNHKTRYLYHRGDSRPAVVWPNGNMQWYNKGTLMQWYDTRCGFAILPGSFYTKSMP